MSQLDFEKPVLELESKIAELRHVSSGSALNIAEDIARMQDKADRLLTQTYGRLSPDQKVQVARHQERPHFLDYIQTLVQDFTPLAGDRNFAEDHALIGGLGRFNGQSCVIMGHEKGADTQGRIKHNFGMARPEGYRKAQRLMEMASQFRLPVITLVDTAGAYPGKGAEERGQSEAIAKSIEKFLRADVPIISVIIGEGGSGGAIAIAVADRIYMLEHAIYSVISPEGCASILWKTAERASDAAEALGITAHRLKALGVIDKIVNEPVGGAHRDTKWMAAHLKRALNDALRQVVDLKPKELLQRRYERLQSYGRFADTKER